MIKNIFLLLFCNCFFVLDRQVQLSCQIFYVDSSNRKSPNERLNVIGLQSDIFKQKGISFLFSKKKIINFPHLFSSSPRKSGGLGTICSFLRLFWRSKHLFLASSFHRKKWCKTSKKNPKNSGIVEFHSFLQHFRKFIYWNSKLKVSIRSKS